MSDINELNLTAVSTDEFGVTYSKDKTRLLKANYELMEYTIPDGTEEKGLLEVTFPDGRKIFEKSAAKTLSKTIEELDIEQVVALNLRSHGKPFPTNDANLIHKMGARKQSVGDGYYVFTGSYSTEKKELLDKISKQLNLGLTVKIIPQVRAQALNLSIIYKGKKIQGDNTRQRFINVIKEIIQYKGIDAVAQATKTVRPLNDNEITYQDVPLGNGYYLRTKGAAAERMILEKIAKELNLDLRVVETNPQTETEQQENDDLKEGGVLDSHGTSYERNREARQKCIEHYGYKCVVCGFDFEEKYGELGKEFIEVHHLCPLSEDEERNTNPIKDLRPVCSNCHSMLHRNRYTTLTIEELQKSINK
jgi:predicted HNH restriction endonuclease